MKLKIRGLLFVLISTLLMACAPATGVGVGDISPLPFSPVAGAPYLDILNGKIFNTSVHMEYSRNGGVDWTDCDGSIQDLSTTLAVGDHIIVRDGTDTSWQRDLGTVTSLTGAPDFYPAGKLYIGNGGWNDYWVAKPGDSINIFSYMNNLGTSANYGQRIHFYLSNDNIIDTNDDYLFYDYDYNYITPAGELYISNSSDFTLLVPDIPAGTYYIGAIMDAENVVSELNEGNNVTQPENMAVLMVSDDDGLVDGAVKIVNSWGTGGTWQNITSDGHYWMPYSVMKSNHLSVHFYKNDFSSIYSPSLIAQFQITHAVRDELKVTLGLGNPSSPVISKTFETRTWSGDPIGGNKAFPSNPIILDITEFAYAINDYDLYMTIENTGTTAGSLDSFSVEFYSDYLAGTTAHAAITSSNTGAIAASSIKQADITTNGQLTRGELIVITPPVQRSNDSSSNFNLESPTSDEITLDKMSIGVFQAGTNYNQLYQGRYGTGYKPPTVYEWNSMLKLRSIDNSMVRATYGGSTLPDEIDNSDTQYFPPIGNQGGKGSCSAFSVGYYIQTYMEAKEHNWDLSSVTWNSGDNTTSEAGAPNSNLDKIFSPDFLYHQINEGTDGGAYIGYAIETILRQGGATWDTMPYVSKYGAMVEADYTAWPSEAAWREAPLYRGNKMGNFYWTNDQSGYFVINDDSDIQMLKTLLSMGYIVSTAIHTDTTYDALDLKDVVGAAGVWYGTNGIDHAQTIVGYKEGVEWNAASPDT